MAQLVEFALSWRAYGRGVRAGEVLDGIVEVEDGIAGQGSELGETAAGFLVLTPRKTKWSSGKYGRGGGTAFPGGGMGRGGAAFEPAVEAHHRPRLQSVLIPSEPGLLLDGGKEFFFGGCQGLAG